MDSKLLPLQLLEFRPDGRSRMAVALLLSVCVHAALLAWRMGSPPAPVTQAAALEITLVNRYTTQAPRAAQVLAQHDLDGGGEHAQGIAATRLPQTDITADEDLLLVALRQRETHLQAEQQRLLTLLESRQTAASGDHHKADDLNQETADQADDVQQHEQWLQSRIGALRDDNQRDHAQPRQKVVGPAAREAAQARYVEAWRERIELIGTRHYPPEARGRIYGSLQLTIFIRRDGQLDHIQFDRPSEHAVLNSAARRIIELAAPFDPLPPELAQDADLLAITRTWQFTHDGMGTAANALPTPERPVAPADTTGGGSASRP